MHSRESDILSVRQRLMIQYSNICKCLHTLLKLKNRGDFSYSFNLNFFFFFKLKKKKLLQKHRRGGFEVKRAETGNYCIFLD